MRDIKKVWDANLPVELEHWRGWMTDPVNRERLSPEFPFPEQDGQRWPEGSTIRAIDIGSGPASTVGTRWPGRKISVLLVDPLADEYNPLLASYGYPPNIIRGSGETLLSDVQERDFDFVHSGNALDHCYDPILCILNMIAIAAPAALIMFAVFENEGRKNAYGGLHQWDFSLNDRGQLMLADAVVGHRMPPGFEIVARRSQIQYGTIIMATIENRNRRRPVSSR